MRLVDDDNVILRQQPVVQQLTQQHTIGEVLAAGVAAGAVVETHRVAHSVAKWRALLVGDASGQVDGSNTTRLGDCDAVLAEQELRQLCRFSGPSLANQHSGTVGVDVLEDLLVVGVDREREHGVAVPVSVGICALAVIEY